MKFIKIGKNKIGNNYNPYIIVEACKSPRKFQFSKKMIHYSHKVVANVLNFNII